VLLIGKAAREQKAQHPAATAGGDVGIP